MRDLATRSNRMDRAAAIGRARAALMSKIIMTVTSEAGRTRAS